MEKRTEKNRLMMSKITVSRIGYGDIAGKVFETEIVKTPKEAKEVEERMAKNIKVRMTLESGVKIPDSFIDITKNEMTMEWDKRGRLCVSPENFV